MSWTSELYQVYENNCGKEDEKITLLPVSHSTANAQIEISISEEGEFRGAARLADKNDSVTIIPVTEDSGTRSSGIAPHPLLDKLIYIAGDYPDYVEGSKTDNTKYYQAYLKQLQGWMESKFAHPAVKAIFLYISKGTLIKDLIEAGVFLSDDHTGKLKKGEKILGIAQEDCFVRFRIEYHDFLNLESRVWKDPSLYESYIQFQEASMENSQLCYATGKLLPCTYKHPSKIRNAGDKAKLISSNDESGFSYRGRFDSKGQALSVSFDFSQKMHNALKWLIEKQGIHIGSMTLLMWESNLQPLPDLFSMPGEKKTGSELDDMEPDDIDLNDIFMEESDPYTGADTLPLYRKWLSDVIWGYQKELDESSKAMILILDAATTGRLSINLYEEMQSSELFHNMGKWHENIAWDRYQWKERKRTVKSFPLIEIVDCAYGTEQGDKIVCKQELKNTILLRLIPCVIRGQDLPEDLITNLVNKASNPQAYKNSYNWRRVLETACGMIRKKQLEILRKKGKMEEFSVSLNRGRQDRDYLYGRLLAIAEAAEASTYEKGDSRATNASRLFEVYSKRPYQTWEILHARLDPYFNRMKQGQRVYYTKLMCEVADLFKDEAYRDNTKLKPDYLLGYYCQLSDIYTKKDEKQEGN